jgi:hypothetical protein
MVVLMASGILGGLIASAAAAPWLGVAGGVAVAPFGGSVAALAAGVLVATSRRNAERQRQPLPYMTTDEQVKALRDIAARGRASAPRRERAAGDRAA